jgi:transcriptional regulator with XRE-family HTH domain
VPRKKRTSPAPTSSHSRSKATQAKHPSAAEHDFAPEVGTNLKRLRDARNLSLEKLAQLTGVSRAMLGQIELGQSTPTIRTVWKISRALDVPFSALLSGSLVGETVLLRAAETRRMTNEKRTFVSRALFPLGGPRRVEFYELCLAAHAEERAVAHAAGTVENLAVHQGKVEIEVRGERYLLSAGDVFVFQADAPHVYRNLTQRQAIFYLVMTYS